MMRWIYLLVILSASLIGCSTTKPTLSEHTQNNRLSVTSTNLSEDGSILSSKEDELLLLVFSYRGEPGELLIQESFTFDQEVRSWSRAIKPIAPPRPKLVVLLELDSFRDPELISRIVSENYPKLMESFRRHNLEGIEAILGDDDLLGIQILNPQDRKITFAGTWRMDRYEYQIILSGHQ